MFEQQNDLQDQNVERELDSLRMTIPGEPGNNEPIVYNPLSHISKVLIIQFSPPSLRAVSPARGLWMVSTMLTWRLSAKCSTSAHTWRMVLLRGSASFVQMVK